MRGKKRLPRVVSYLIADEVMWQKSTPPFEFQTDGYETLGIYAVKCWQPKSLFFIRKTQNPQKRNSSFTSFMSLWRMSFGIKASIPVFHPCLSPTKPQLQVLFLFPRSWIVVDNFFSLCFIWVVFGDTALVIV